MTLQRQPTETVFPPPVWVSSVHHLHQFIQIVASASPWWKLLGAYRLPDGFPYLWGWLTPFIHIPVIYVANGRLTLTRHSMVFESVPRSLFLMTVANVRDDLDFEIHRSEIDSVRRYMVDPEELRRFLWELPQPFPAPSYYNFPWTRVRTTSKGFTGDFLIGLGGVGPSMRGIRDRNERFFEFMSEFQPT